jgi:hypothetical protein
MLCSSLPRRACECALTAAAGTKLDACMHVRGRRRRILSGGASASFRARRPERETGVLVIGSMMMVVKVGIRARLR